MTSHFLTLITRCRDEPFLEEFLEHYFHEGVDRVYIVDDNKDLDMPSAVAADERVKIVTAELWKDTTLRGRNTQMEDVNALFAEIRGSSEWFISVDCDEFVTTRRHSERTIREELQATFRKADCVMVPWLMMASNQKQEDPGSLLDELIYRWDHDRKHPHPDAWRKGRCRYEEIEVKSIFRPEKVSSITAHFPQKKRFRRMRVVDSIDGLPIQLGPFYKGLRNRDIERAFLICCHYRIASQESARRKLATSSKLWAGGGYQAGGLEAILAADYPEVEDRTLQRKARSRRREGSESESP